ncbi:MAG: DNA-binding protein, partial [Kiritimatiellaceae bacterium]|nr:DNA-binding protein [Kiritimatiellaceae bacterium]
KMLMQLPGVGEKIADCVLLFGLGRMESFPIDTWIEKILIRFYQLEGYSKNQLQQFARAHFGANAGYAQQFLFSAARSEEIMI